MLAMTSVPDSGRDAMSSDLRKRGVRVGAHVPLKDLLCARDQGERALVVTESKRPARLW